MSMTALTEERSETENTAPASLKRMLVALDASEHANRALEESIRLAVAGTLPAFTPMPRNCMTDASR